MDGSMISSKGAHLKKLRRAEGDAKIFGVFRVKNHDFTPKNHIYSNFRGGARRVRPPLNPPLHCDLLLSFMCKEYGIRWTGDTNLYPVLSSSCAFCSSFEDYSAICCLRSNMTKRFCLTSYIQYWIWNVDIISNGIQMFWFNW